MNGWVLANLGLAVINLYFSVVFSSPISAAISLFCLIMAAVEWETK